MHHFYSNTVQVQIQYSLFAIKPLSANKRFRYLQEIVFLVINTQR